MRASINRREFLTAASLAAAGLAIAPVRGADSGGGSATTFKTTLHKALIRNKPTEEELTRLKAAGFGGVEAGVIPVAEAEQCRAAADKLGLRIHSVLRGWAEFNSSDAAKVEASYKLTEDALRAAQAFGADAVLLVPCRIGGMAMPRPWEFLIEFDEPTGHLQRVTAGDNAPFADYIKAHNHAIDTSRKQVERLIPLAEKCGVVIALENVWNNLWVKPALFRHFVASFKNPWVKAYYDIGNHVKYAASEEWILTLGDLIAKCHVKDFKLDPSDAKGEGKFVDIRDGSIRWPVVRAALDRIGYNGWMTIEGGSLSNEDHCRRLDQIVAGV